MAMTFGRVTFNAHHGQRMLQIEKPVEVVVKGAIDHTLIVPFPNRVSCSAIDSLGANLAGDAPFLQVVILKSSPFQRFLEIRFA